MRASGFKNARERNRRRADILQENAGGAIEQIVDDVHRSGHANIRAMVKKRRGNLLRFYKRKVSRNRLSGQVGLTTKAGRKRAFYARFINDGTVKMKARPFHDHAVLEHEGAVFARMRRALSSAVRLQRRPRG